MSDPNRPPSDTEALSEVLAERAREHAGPERGDPEPEELLDYLEGRLSPEAEEEMGRRLLASPSATRELLDLSELTRAGGGEEEGAATEPVDLEVRAGWRDFQRRLEAESAPARRASRVAPALAALAAGLFLVVVGLSVQLWRLERADRPESPVLVANVRTLELDEGLRSDRVPTVAVEPGELFQGLLFPPEPCSVYRMEVDGPGGGEPLRLGGLEVDELGRLTFLLRSEPGRYTLRLLGCEPERDLSSYGFEIARPVDVTSEVNGP